VVAATTGLLGLAPAALAQRSNALGDANTYKPTWKSLEEHEVPVWYEDAKLGIFIHRGLYSLPGWAPR